jgi:hypothetical protein
MSESRRMDNARMKSELGVRLRYPSVLDGLVAGAGAGTALQPVTRMDIDCYFICSNKVPSKVPTFISLCHFQHRLR